MKKKCSDICLEINTKKLGDYQFVEPEECNLKEICPFKNCKEETATEEEFIERWREC